MQLCNVVTQKEMGMGLPEIVKENHQIGKGGCRSGILTNEVSMSFPDISGGRGNGMPL